MRNSMILPRITPIVVALLALVAATVLPSAPESASAQVYRPPAPTGIDAQAVDEGTVHVIWTAHPNGAKDYRVAWTPAGKKFRGYRLTDWNAFPTGTAHTITGLEAGSTYKVKVRARFNYGLHSRWSTVVTVTTPAPKGIARSVQHDPPQQLRAYTNDASPDNPWGAIWVEWDNPSLFVQVIRTAPGLPSHARTATTTTIVRYSGLRPDTTYTFEVRLGTSANDLGPAGTVTATTASPPHPMDLRTAILTTDAITLEWSADFNPEPDMKTHVRQTPHGSTSPDYTEEYGGDVYAHAESQTFAGGDRYTYEVWFSVEAGDTRYSGMTAALDVTVPHHDQPQDLTASPRIGTTSLNWALPTGHAVTRHWVERRQGTSSEFETVRQEETPATSFHDNFLDEHGDWKEGTVYQYRVYLGDADGWGNPVQIEVTTPELPELAAPTNVRVVNATLTNDVYEVDGQDPQLVWDVPSEQDGGGVGVRVRRQLIDPPEGVTCLDPGECPVMTLYDGSRPSSYTDSWNGGGRYRYWVQFVGRDKTRGPQTAIDVQVSSQPSPRHVAPTNVRLTAGPATGAARFTVTWRGERGHPGYLVQWRRSDQQYNAGETGTRSVLDVASNRLNMWEADGRQHQPARTHVSWNIQGNATPDPWNTTYYVRVGTCKTSDCAIDDVVFAPEVNAHLGRNPYG